jgi:pyruvate/2-oxoglutarate dehydrogenase complex dihydrolipoamide dehydrogenase (E3) component
MNPEGTGELILPDDEHNRMLVDNVHPSSWVNPTPSGRYNLVVLGAGTAGLVSAVGAAGLGAKVAIVERHLMGGDCLNFGCVPSKSILRAAHAIHHVRSAGDFGINVAGEVRTDFGIAMERMRRLRAGISKNDSAHRLKSLGVDVFIGPATFVGPNAVDVEGHTLEFSRAVIATGARSARIPVPGLDEVGFLTNETIFSLTELPRRFIIIGAGPIGCELAQAFRRLGSEVVILSLDPRLLPREDEDAAATLAACFGREGIDLALGVELRRAERRKDKKVLVFERGGQEAEVVGDEILLAVGRTPNIEGLELETAGVGFDKAGVRVNDRLRTTNRRIYAAGDVCSTYKFTHAADAMARIVLQNALFPFPFGGRKKASSLVMPWCTYTDPEIAHVGLYQGEAKRQGLSITTLTVPLADMDRAILDDGRGAPEGFARVHVVAGSGRIVGATMVASHAGEMIGEMALAVTQGLTIASIAKSIHPYPTQAEAWKRLGDSWNRSRLTPRVRRIFERWFRWMR